MAWCAPVLTQPAARGLPRQAGTCRETEARRNRELWLSSRASRKGPEHNPGENSLGVSTEGKISIPGVCLGFAVGVEVHYKLSYAACGCPQRCPGAEQTRGEREQFAQSAKSGTSASRQAGLKRALCEQIQREAGGTKRRA